MQIRNKKEFKDYLFKQVLCYISEESLFPGDTYLYETTILFTLKNEKSLKKLKKWKKECEGSLKKTRPNKPIPDDQEHR